MEVIKKDERIQEFDFSKIENSIVLSNNSVDEAYRMDAVDLQKVIGSIKRKLKGFTKIKVDDIADIVEKTILDKGFTKVGKNYIIYRNEKNVNKVYNEIESKALAVLEGTSDLRGDNANKKIDDNGCIRDYLAGLVCKSIAKKVIPQDIRNAHEKGLIHFHDEDYSPVMREHNCDLINCEDMLTHGFQMGDTKIVPHNETPFRTIANLFAQINLIVSGRQYGGQTISWAHALPFIDYTRRLYRAEVMEDVAEFPKPLAWLIRRFCGKILERRVERKVRKEIVEGVKTYQYQILCHTSSAGQTPFVSNNLCLREAVTQRELDDFAILIEEIFKRRIKGVQNSSGKYVTPLFPKLLYWTCDGLNVKKGDKYYYLTELAALCNIKRTQPDIVSEKQTRKVKNGQIIPSMGCRSLLSPIWEEHTYPIDTEFYWVDVQNNTERNYPYGTFVDKQNFKSIENGTFEIGYEKGQYAINFRGNTGWLKEKTDDTVTIYQPMVYGRFNQGVVTVNIPHVALEAMQYMDDMYPDIKKYSEEYKKTIKEVFYDIFNERLELCHKALLIRNESVRRIVAKNASLLWQYGALARMEENETVGDLMDKYPLRASISLGYAGLYETCEALINQSNTTKEGQDLCLEVLRFMNDKCNSWRENGDMNEDGVVRHLNYSIYGTPEESLSFKLALANRRDFGYIDKITDKDYVVNSYHVDPREPIDAFKKIEVEGLYLALSPGGAVSYVETLDMSNNVDAIISIIQWMHENIIYAEFNRKIGVCYKCGNEGDAELIKTEDGKFVFRCPHCGNEDDSLMDITARICGYLGKINSGNVNHGRLDDIFHRQINLDNKDENFVGMV